MSLWRAFSVSRRSSSSSPRNTDCNPERAVQGALPVSRKKKQLFLIPPQAQIPGTASLRLSQKHKCSCSFPLRQSLPLPRAASLKESSGTEYLGEMSFLALAFFFRVTNVLLCVPHISSAPHLRLIMAHLGSSTGFHHQARPATLRGRARSSSRVSQSDDLPRNPVSEEHLLACGAERSLLSSLRCQITTCLCPVTTKVSCKLSRQGEKLWVPPQPQNILRPPTTTCIISAGKKPCQKTSTW